MSDLKYLVLAIVAAASFLPRGEGRSLVLTEVVNQTVCAMNVTHDRDPNRIPYYIKIIKCAANTHQGCQANGIEQRDCCNNAAQMECVEMRDSVRVFDKLSKITRTIEVPVGCACMINKKNSADSPDGR